MEQIRIPFFRRLFAFFFSKRLLDSLFIGMGLLVLLALLPSRGGHTKVARIVATQNGMHQIETAFLSYQEEYGILPPARDQIGFIRNLLNDNPRKIEFLNLKPTQMNSQGQVLDAWGTPFCITVLGTQHLLLLSAGPDKTWQTADDILLENPQTEN